MFLSVFVPGAIVGEKLCSFIPATHTIVRHYPYRKRILFNNLPDNIVADASWGIPLMPVDSERPSVVDIQPVPGSYPKPVARIFAETVYGIVRQSVLIGQSFEHILFPRMSGQARQAECQNE